MGEGLLDRFLIAVWKIGGTALGMTMIGYIIAVLIKNLRDTYFPK